MDINETATQLISSMQKLSRTIVSKQTADLARGELFALSYLYKRGTAVIPSEISAAMDVSTARVATLLNSLESRGLIVRSTDPEDRRRVDVMLTPEGVKRVLEHQARILEKMKILVEELGEEDALNFLRITERVIDISVNICK